MEGENPGAINYYALIVVLILLWIFYFWVNLFDFQKIEFHATKVAIIEQILKVSILKVLAGLNFGFRLAIFNDVSNPEGTERS